MGWYDPFCELIQNALDSIDERNDQHKNSHYIPKIRVKINLQNNSLVVSDNGIGLNKEKYQQFLAPSFSFKSENTRGHKGVGATYLAYGFNFIQISTRTEDFEATGKMVDARKWLYDENPPGNPKVYPDDSGPIDKEFINFDRGVSVCLKFDKHTNPGDLSWLKADAADKWLSILKIKTGLGAFFKNDRIKVQIIVIDEDGKETVTENGGIEFNWTHLLVKKALSLTELQNRQEKLFAKKGKDFRPPSSMKNLDAIFDTLDQTQLAKIIKFTEKEKQILAKYKPIVYFCYTYSAKVWTQLNDELSIRESRDIFSSGIQIAANNMPQGEIIQIPLKRNIGRQNQMQVVIHFEKCRGDLGRKGFQKDIIEFSKNIGAGLIERGVAKFRYTLRPITGAKNDLLRENEIDNWKDEMLDHEKQSPLHLENENFFHPMKEISITSTPTREQDVIALFNQLIAGGVIRSLRIMSTNERFIYDGMYRVIFNQPLENHLFNEKNNPLGVMKEYIDIALGENVTSITKPKILEYKFSLDALIEDIANGNKNSNEIDLVVVWETGDSYQGNYHITSLLDPDNLAERQYHGVTHVLTNITSDQREMDLIVLKDLINFLNNSVETIRKQKLKYEEGDAF